MDYIADDAWPFAGRGEELDLVRRSLRSRRHGVVVTGASGTGKSRLAKEAVLGLPRTCRADIRVVEDAHLLDAQAAARLERLAIDRSIRLLITVRSDDSAPPPVSKLWRDGLLPRLELQAMDEEGTAAVLAAALGGRPDTLTVRRLRHFSQGNPRLLRELIIALREAGELVEACGCLMWRGAPPMTGRVRDLIEAEIGEIDDVERETLERIAFGVPVEPTATLERLEVRGLLVAGEDLSVRLTHPLYGPALRSRAGRLRAYRLGLRAAAVEETSVGEALAAEIADLASRASSGDLKDIPAGVGERLAEADEGWAEPDMPEFCAFRALAARLRGEIRDALAWSADGLRRDPRHPRCLAEFGVAAAYLGDFRAHSPWGLAVGGDLTGAIHLALQAMTGVDGDDLFVLHDAVRLGAGRPVADRLVLLAERMDGDLAPLLARHATALLEGDAEALDKIARRLEELGLLLHAAETAAHAARVHGSSRAAHASRAYATTLARACQGARTPTLLDLAAPQLTRRQRQVAFLAASGLSNRQIAEQLALSMRTVGNHLCAAYLRLGSSDRACLRQLFADGIRPIRTLGGADHREGQAGHPVHGVA